MTEGDSPTDISNLLQQAYRQIKSLRSRLAEHEQRLAEHEQVDSIAIVGMGCRFPGNVHSPESFWRLLVDGIDAVEEIPRDRWDVDAFYDADPTAAGKHYAIHGSFLRKVDEFDHEFFGIAPAEVAHLDPQQRLLLEVAWETLEHAGIAPDSLRGTRTGAYVGAIYGDYLIRQLREAGCESINAYYGTGNTLSGMAGRLSYFFGWHGPSISLDTACSSSLVAVHQACQAIRNRECDAALAGGVSLMLTPEPTINLSKARMMSPTGRCRTFDAAADGYVRGEGCGLVLLQRLSVAKAQGSRILGVIRGSAVNHDGRSNGITAPNRQAQVALIRTALHSAGLKPEDVGYVECHGTGTSLGDPIEVGAITEALLAGRPSDRPLALGAVKTNYGHLEGAAGICGLIKAALVTAHASVTANLHLESLNPYIKTDNLPVRFPRTLTPWFHGFPSRIAGVSSFGLLGTNAHVVLEAFAGHGPASVEETGPRVLALSARTGAALRSTIQLYSEHLEVEKGITLADLCHTANTGRNHFEYRAGFVASDLTQLRVSLQSAQAGTPSSEAKSRRSSGRDPRIAFVFTGQGSQYAGMGKDLYASEPVFREALDRCSEIAGFIEGRSLMDVIFAEGGESSLLHSTNYTQPALFAIEFAMAELWASWGIRPAICLGHSVGEYVAACVAGVFSLEDALRIVAARGALMQRLPLNGSMAAVRASETETRNAIGEFAPSVSVAAVNSPSETVISGRDPDVQIVVDRLNKLGYSSRALEVSHAFHSPLMQPMLREFESVLDSVRFGQPAIPVVSNVTGRIARDGELSRPAYWTGHILSPVRFSDSVQSLAAYGCELIMELGPQPILGRLIRKNVPDATWQVFSPALGDGAQMAALCDLYRAGARVDWNGFERNRSGRRISLPTYPFERRRIWFDDGKEATAPRVSVKFRSPVVPARNGFSPARDQVRFSLMFFAATQKLPEADRYRLVVEAARFADQNDFQSIWVPERHFSNLGSLYPNPAILHAALARETHQLRLMAGSVVAPLHDPVRIAEEWSMVDNLSGGRVGISFASGWNPDDFVFFPDRYPDRRDHLFTIASEVQRLWRGEAVNRANGVGKMVPEGIAPPPLQKELPFWITAAGNPQTFEKAGEVGANLLTHLLDQSVEDLAEKIRLYRASRVRHGHPADKGTVTVMVHTSMGPDAAAARDAARLPFCNYLKASRGLLAGLAISRGREIDVNKLSEPDLDDLVNFLFDRFSSTRALIGSPESCGELVHSLAAAGVNEIACLLDFGQTPEQVLAGLPSLNELRLNELRLNELKPKPKLRDSVIKPPTDLSALFHQTTWASWMRPAAVSATRSKQWLIFADRGDVGARLAANVGKGNCFVIRQGQAPALHATNEFWVPDLTEDHFAKISSAVSASSVGQLRVVFLWPLDAQSIHKESALELEASQSLVTEAARQLVQRLSRSLNQRKTSIFWVTRGAVRLEGDSHLPALAQSPLSGFARVLRLEKAEWTSTLIDLDPRESDARNADWFLQSADGFELEDRIAIRNGGLWAERLTRNPVLRRRNQIHKIEADGTYLVTGGLGGVGLAVADWLVERGARSVLLLGRSSPNGAAKQTIASLQRRGANVNTAAVDISDETALQAALANYREDGAPAIRGVVHAAGTWQDTPLERMDSAALASVLAPKVAGTWNLERQLTEPLDFFISFSSLASVLPAHGQANYAAANAFLDAHAQWRHAQGKPALSIQWGPWAEVGFGATAAGLRAHQRLESFGMYRMTPGDALRALEMCLDSEMQHAVVAKVDWNVLAKVDPALARLPLLHKLMDHVDSTTGPPARPERVDDVFASVATIVAGVFRQPVTELHVDEPLPNLGLDSLMAMEIKNRILAQMDVNIPVSQFLSGASVRSLATWAQTDLQLRQLAGTSAPAETEAETEEFAL